MWLGSVHAMAPKDAKRLCWRTPVVKKELAAKAKKEASKREEATKQEEAGITKKEATEQEDKGTTKQEASKQEASKPEAAYLSSAPWRAHRGSSSSQRAPQPEDTDSDEWSRKPGNQDLSYRLVMALRFKFAGQQPTVGEQAKACHESVNDVWKAIRHSRRLHNGKTHDKYFLPIAASTQAAWRVSAIPRSRPKRPWQQEAPAEEAEDDSWQVPEDAEEEK